MTSTAHVVALRLLLTFDFRSRGSNCGPRGAHAAPDRLPHRQATGKLLAGEDEPARSGDQERGRCRHRGGLGARLAPSTRLQPLLCRSDGDSANDRSHEPWRDGSRGDSNQRRISCADTMRFVEAIGALVVGSGISDGVDSRNRMAFPGSCTWHFIAAESEFSQTLRIPAPPAFVLAGERRSGRRKKSS